MLNLRTEAVRLSRKSTPDVDGLCSFDFQALIEDYLTDQVTRAVFLDAETGAGKTRGFSLSALKHRQNLIIVAPTNALIQDIRKNVELLRDRIGAPHQVYSVTRYALYALRGLTPPNRRPSQGQAFLSLLRGEEGDPRQPLVIITNPDSLAVALQSLYYDSARILAEILHRFPWLVFDEFHAYTPKQIPAILLLHALVNQFANSKNRKTIFSSATPNNLFPEALCRLLDLDETSMVKLSAKTASNGFQVLQPTALAILPRSDSWDTSELRQLIARSIPVIRSHLQHSDHHRVCVIANSVFEASEIADLLEKEGFKRGQALEEIRGFMASGERGHGERPIVVGTSAIELGVNFPISMLFTEGYDGPSLIQRLGRLGRSSENGLAKAYTIVPQPVYDTLTDLQDQNIPRSIFRERVLDAYPKFESFWDYVKQFGLYENRFYIQQMAKLNTPHRSEKHPLEAPRQQSYLEDLLLPALARSYQIDNWQLHLLLLDQEISKRGRKAKESVERVLASPRGEVIPFSCAIFDRADERRGLFPFKVYDARIIQTRGDILNSGDWVRLIKDGKERSAPPKWYQDKLLKYKQSHPEKVEEHFQELESETIKKFVEINGLQDDIRKIAYTPVASLRGLKIGSLYALELHYWFESFFDQSDFSDALEGLAILVTPLQYGLYQGALKQIRNLPPLFEISTLHINSAAYQVTFGINALYIWCQSLLGSKD